MKIAITGKGGVGKTTIAGLLIWQFASDGFKVIGVDADPDSNLVQFFGISEDKVLPLSEMKELIAERVEVQSGTASPFLRLNPRVDDIPQKYSVEYRGIRLLVMGGLKGAGTGCYCPENSFLKNLIQHLLVQEEEVVILDMEAGIEHLSRGTAKSVDFLIIIVEPTMLSINTAFRIRALANQLQIHKICVIANKVSSQEDRDFISSNLTDFNIIGLVSFDSRLKEADRTGRTFLSYESILKGQIRLIKDKLKLELTQDC